VRRGRRVHEGGSTESEGFLPATRTDSSTLAAEIVRAAESPIITALLEAAEAAAAVLDQHRQVIAFNTSYLGAAGVVAPQEVLGLRPGEALDCIHPQGVETGCGTTHACPTCGAALAILSALHGRPAERRCALRILRDGAVIDREFRARAMPLALDGAPLLLLVLRDVSAEARRAMLERSFMHDLSNMVAGLQAAADDLTPGEDGGGAQDVRILADQLAHEVRLQKLLAAEDPGRVERLQVRPVEVSDAFALLRRAIERHPSCEARAVDWPRIPTGLRVLGDLTALHHVLANMALNALEAVPAGGRIRAEAVAEPARVRLCVWNPGVIPAAVRPRIFQRYFSTKGEAGRGHGTWAMKLFGEELLGGEVRFETSEAGTTFEIALPRATDDAPADRAATSAGPRLPSPP
jgi:signal transduction histidine kinase